MNKPSILIAEDDLNLGILLVDYLETKGFSIHLVKDGESAIDAIQKNNFQLCILDIMMPKTDGISVGNFLHKHYPKMPFLFLTSKSMKEDKQIGYFSGAEDYIIKPFDEEELVWKINAILKRNTIIEAEKIGNIRIGNYSFEPMNLLLKTDGYTKRITDKENSILLYLCRNANKVIRREDMLIAIWGTNDYFMGRSLDVFITKIRKYLNRDAGIQIENVFGVGFIFHAEIEEENS
jgi:DNA-binding response OmpR family regulator